MSANVLQFPDFLFSPLMMFDCGESASSKPSRMWTAPVERVARTRPRTLAEPVRMEDADAAQIWKLMGEIGELMGARS